MLETGITLEDRYHIIAQLSSQNGILRYAAQLDNGQKVVLLQASKEQGGHALSLANILNKTSHQGLPAIHEIIEMEGIRYVVLETPAGRPLNELWQDISIAEEQRLIWILQLCHILDALHRAGAIATVLRPETLLVVDGQLVLTDPSWFQTFPRSSFSGPADFPVYYTAPELWENPSLASERADVYAVGALIISLLLGRELREEDWQEDSLTPIREILPTVAPEVADLLQRATQRDPSLRPATTSLLSALFGSLEVLLSPRLVAGAATNIGLARLANEDRYLLRLLASRTPYWETNAVLLAVADGIGGERGGATASRIALEHVEAFLAPHLDAMLAQGAYGLDDQMVFSLMQQAADTADQSVRTAAQEDPELPYMGTTLAIALLVEGQAYIGNAGDSRVYLVNGPSLQQLSEDHTITSELVRQGQLERSEVRYHPYHRQLTRAVGYGFPTLSTTKAPLEEGQAILLCSDGLTEVVTDEEIAALFATHQGPEAICRQLTHLANLQGGPDNITAVALRRMPRRLFGWYSFRPEEDMPCYQCGSVNAGTAQFCQSCGSRLQAYLGANLAKSWIICPFCNASNTPEAHFCNTCGQLLPLTPGVLFASRYRVVRMLAQGGMGRAYLVDDLQARELRVLKEIITDANSSLRQQETYESYFRNEAEVQSRLRALRTVPAVLEPVQEHESRYFFVMEYVPGEDLAKVMRRRGRPFPHEVVREWGIQLCDLLSYLHNYQPSVSIVHRDITPDNVKLRGKDPETSGIALLDFGIARMAEHGHHLTQGLGKQGYVAPEQLQGRPEPRSDLYSLAATMHFLLTNRDPGVYPPPFPAANELNPAVPPWLSEIISINLRDNPEQRYPSAAILREDLREGRVTHTITCPMCGRENPHHLTNCQWDGALLQSSESRCVSCQARIPFNAGFCPDCGVKQG